MAARCRFCNERCGAADKLRRRAPHDAGPEVAKLTKCGGVEGAHLHAVDAERAETLAHLARGARGEGDSQGAPGIVRSDAHGVRNAVGDRACLARAGPGPDDDGAVEGLGHRPLLGVEGLQGVIHAGMVAPGSDVGEADHPREDDDVSAPALTMYTTQWCGFCMRLKAQLAREGIEVAEIDIEVDPEAAAFVESVNGGNQTVPTVVFPDGTAMTNPSLGKVKEKLGV